MHLIHRMSNYFCLASAPHGNYDPAVTILSRISLASRSRGTDHYAGMVPAYLVLVCGVLGNMTDDDVRRTIGYCAQLRAHGGRVVWTRGRREPDLRYSSRTGRTACPGPATRP
jgi:hypothetical protein